MGRKAIPPQNMDQAKLRRQLEAGAGVRELAKRHGVSRAEIRRHTGAAPPAAAGTAPRLKRLLSRQIAALEEKPADDALLALHRLACISQKTIDIEKKETARNDAGKPRTSPIDDASRDALARRIEALAEQWEAAADPGGPGGG